MSYNAEKQTFRQTAIVAISAMRASGQCKNELFWHIRKCINEKGGDLKQGLDLFLSRCAEQERWMTSKEAGQMYVVSVPELWQQGKSDCKRSVENGVNPLDYPSYSAMREAKTTKSKGAQALNKAASAERKDKAEGVTTVEEALASGEVIDAKATTICPEDLLPLVACLAPLSELTRKRTVNRLMQVAGDARKAHDEGVAEGKRRVTA